MRVLTLIQSVRLPFLLLTPICVFLGFRASGADYVASTFWIVIAGALFAHIAVNALNEYSDFKTGLDLNTIKTPFSGGSGALPSDPDSAGAVLVLGLASLFITVLVGCYLVWLSGVELLLMGVLGIALVALYTPWINKTPLVCLVAPGLGFGTLMVLGSSWVFTQALTFTIFLVSLVPFFLVNNLLLLNQFPDLEADRAAGRNHLIIRYGTDVGARVYGIFIFLAAVTIVFGVVIGLLPLFASFSLIALVPGLIAWRNVTHLKENISQEPKYLAMNVATALIAPLLVALFL